MGTPGKRSAALQRAQETTGSLTAQGVDDKINVMRNVLRGSFRVIYEFVGAEFTQERLVLARRHCDHPRALPLGYLHREVPHAACGSVHEDGLALERHRLMLVRLKRVLFIVSQLDHQLPRGEQRHWRCGGMHTRALPQHAPGLRIEVVPWTERAYDQLASGASIWSSAPLQLLLH